jgi:DNA polymerase-3 subunit alpha
MKYINYFETGTCLYVTGKFEKWEKRNEWNFRVMEICLLETIKKSMTKGLEMSIMGELLKIDIVNFLALNIKKHPGNSRMKLVVYEPKQNWHVTMVSMAKGFEMNDELSAFLMDHPYIDINVITSNSN